MGHAPCTCLATLPGESLSQDEDILHRKGKGAQMTAIDDSSLALREAWEKELCAGHRWGDARHGEKVVIELTHLTAMWEVIPAQSRPSATLVSQILALEICNWNLESSILALCQAIGNNECAQFSIGHLASCTEERWRKIWAYYLALLDWLPRNVPGGIGALLAACDPEGTVADHVRDLLGERTPLKERYVQRFCLTLECRLHGLDETAPQDRRWLQVAGDVLDEEIRRLDQDPQLLQAISLHGVLFPCHHKLFRRYAIILSSIGVGKWRGAMAVKGDGPAERARTVERLLQPIDAWVTGGTPRDERLFATIVRAFGPPNPTKRFLAALLISLLRSQKRAE